MNAFMKMVRHPLKFRLFLLFNLPSAYFAGVRIKYISEEKCAVTVPYNGFQRPPFAPRIWPVLPWRRK